MLAALEKTLGVVTTAAKMAGIDRTTHYLWTRTDEEYKEAAESIQEVLLDFAETKLHELIKNSEPSAIYFLLKTKGKKRGFIEKQIHDHQSDGERINNINVNVIKSG